MNKEKNTNNSNFTSEYDENKNYDNKIFVEKWEQWIIIKHKSWDIEIKKYFDIEFINTINNILNKKFWNTDIQIYYYNNWFICESDNNITIFDINYYLINKNNEKLK